MKCKICGDETDNIIYIKIKYKPRNFLIYEKYKYERKPKAVCDRCCHLVIRQRIQPITDFYYENKKGVKQ